MKFEFALVDGERRKAEPGLSGKCCLYGHAMIARCGEHNVWHWAHVGTRTCDPWWEPQTKWHRDWKNRFLEDWQEIIQQAEDGEKHIADVKTDFGVVIEFQHSFLPRDEREARENFYRNMVWVVDGLRRKRDRPRFFESIGLLASVKAKPLTFSLPLNKCALLRDWVDSRKPVFFDFADNSEPGDPLSFPAPVLWRLEPRSQKDEAHLSPVLKTSFLDKYREGLVLRASTIGRSLAPCMRLSHSKPLSPEGFQISSDTWRGKGRGHGVGFSATQKTVLGAPARAVLEMYGAKK